MIYISQVSIVYFCQTSFLNRVFLLTASIKIDKMPKELTDCVIFTIHLNSEMNINKKNEKGYNLFNISVSNII